MELIMQGVLRKQVTKLLPQHLYDDSRNGKLKVCTPLLLTDSVVESRFAIGNEKRLRRILSKSAVKRVWDLEKARLSTSAGPNVGDHRRV
jgi:hypothetical protein